MKNQFKSLSRKEMTLILGGANVGGATHGGPGGAQGGDQTGGCGLWTSSNPYGGTVPPNQVSCSNYGTTHDPNVFTASCVNASGLASTCYIAAA